MLEIRIDEELLLRVPTQENAEEINDVVRANLEHLKVWMIWATENYDIADACAFISKNLEDTAAGRCITFSIFYNDKIVGGIGLNKFDREKKLTEIGYWIITAHEGKGLVTRCCRALIDHAFDNEGMERVEIVASSINFRSRAVPERLKFELDGIHEGLHPMPGGKFDDQVVYSLSSARWKELNGR